MLSLSSGLFATDYRFAAAVGSSGTLPFASMNPAFSDDRKSAPGPWVATTLCQ